MPPLFLYEPSQISFFYIIYFVWSRWDVGQSVYVLEAAKMFPTFILLVLKYLWI